MHPPPNFHAAAPASIPLSGPSICYPLGEIETVKRSHEVTRQDQCQIRIPIRIIRGLALETSATLAPLCAGHDRDTQSSYQDWKHSYRSPVLFRKH